MKPKTNKDKREELPRKICLIDEMRKYQFMYFQQLEKIRSLLRKEGVKL